MAFQEIKLPPIERFFILDCNEKIVGNPLGYATIRGAIRESERQGSPAYRAIWAAFESARAANPDHKALSKIVHFESLNETVRGILASRLQ
jgi:hypothetical protein